MLEWNIIKIMKEIHFPHTETEDFKAVKAICTAFLKHQIYKAFICTKLLNYGTESVDIVFTMCPDRRSQ
jgi:hypothetical protein